jgi:hypothetical protein
MSVDASLVPRRALRLREERAGAEPLLVQVETGLSLEQVAGSYGPPQSTSRLDPDQYAGTADLLTGAASALVGRLHVHWYGEFGVGGEAGSGRVVAFLFGRTDGQAP